MSLAPLLAELDRTQLLREVVEAEAAYAFKHALTHETAYGSLLRKRRVEVHGVVAHAIEQLYPDRLDEHAALLARHYREAGNDAAAPEISRRAGDAAACVHAHAEAAERYCNAVKLALRSGAGVDMLLPLYISCGRSQELGGRFDEALGQYEAMAAEARRCAARAGGADRLCRDSFDAQPRPRPRERRGSLGAGTGTRPNAGRPRRRIPSLMDPDAAPFIQRPAPACDYLRRASAGHCA